MLLLKDVGARALQIQIWVVTSNYMRNGEMNDGVLSLSRDVMSMMNIKRANEDCCLPVVAKH